FAWSRGASAGALLAGGLLACLALMHSRSVLVNSPPGKERVMDGSLTPLEFPVAAPPPRGEILAIAPGVWWLRMPLPFALDHINLWLLEDGAGWTIVDAGYATAETRELWQRIFAERLAGLPVTRLVVTHYHPDH